VKVSSPIALTNTNASLHR
ncbi:unnamed protein product, partial [Rotaria sordida]